MLSPVDGVDPFGIKKDYIITPGKFLPFATPILILATELDPHSRKLEPPCAPDNMSNTRYPYSDPDFTTQWADPNGTSMPQNMDMLISLKLNIELSALLFAQLARKIVTSQNTEHS